MGSRILPPGPSAVRPIGGDSGRGREAGRRPYRDRGLRSLGVLTAVPPARSPPEPGCFVTRASNASQVEPDQRLASIDGAHGWRRFLYVVLPQLKVVLLLDGMLVGIKSLGSFKRVFALTGGGPGHGTVVLATHVYRLTFSHYDLGLASAVGVCLAGLFLGLVSIVYFLQRGGPEPARKGTP